MTDALGVAVVCFGLAGGCRADYLSEFMKQLFGPTSRSAEVQNTAKTKSNKRKLDLAEHLLRGRSRTAQPDLVTIVPPRSVAPTRKKYEIERVLYVAPKPLCRGDGGDIAKTPTNYSNSDAVALVR